MGEAPTEDPTVEAVEGQQKEGHIRASGTSFLGVLLIASFSGGCGCGEGSDADGDGDADLDSDSDVDSDVDGDGDLPSCDDFGDAVRAALADCCDMTEEQMEVRADLLAGFCRERQVSATYDFEPDLETQCIEMHAAAYADCYVGLLGCTGDNPCFAAMIGLVEETEPCSLDEECVDRLVCASVEGDSVCVTAPSADTACLGGRCADGLFCDVLAGGDAMCRPLVAAGGDCSAFGPGNSCVGGYFCDGSTCLPTPGDGDSCAPALPSCAEGLVCDPDTTTCRPGVVDGDACEEDVECVSACCNIDGVCGISICGPSC